MVDIEFERSRCEQPRQEDERKNVDREGSCEAIFRHAKDAPGDPPERDEERKLELRKHLGQGEGTLVTGVFVEGVNGAHRTTRDEPREDNHGEHGETRKIIGPCG